MKKFAPYLQIAPDCNGILEIRYEVSTPDYSPTDSEGLETGEYVGVYQLVDVYKVDTKLKKVKNPDVDA
jgi:hypothetical protein